MRVEKLSAHAIEESWGKRNGFRSGGERGSQLLIVAEKRSFSRAKGEKRGLCGAEVWRETGRKKRKGQDACPGPSHVRLRGKRKGKKILTRGEGQKLTPTSQSREIPV